MRAGPRSLVRLITALKVDVGGAMGNGRVLTVLWLVTGMLSAVSSRQSAVRVGIARPDSQSPASSWRRSTGQLWAGRLRSCEPAAQV